jgi:BRCA1-associated RING domain protein 1
MGVNEAGLCIRTTKYLRGILDGKTIVTFKWFLDSLSEMKWMDPSAYLVKGDTSIGKESGAVAASMASLSKLFGGYTFYLIGIFGTPSKPDLTSLMKAGGAKILQSKPKTHDPTHVIIYDPDHFNDEVLWIMEHPYRTSGHWLLDCISSYSILPLY